MMATDGVPQDGQFTMTLNLPEGPDDGAANRERLHTAYIALAAGDGEALFKLLDDEVRFSEAASLPYGVTGTGIEAARQGVAGMFGAWTHLHTEFTHFTASHDMVIAYLHMTATSRATGQIYAGPAAEVFRFRNGKIVEWHPIYWDTHAVRTACGVA